jgi:hypothetical protein
MRFVIGLNFSSEVEWILNKICDQEVRCCVDETGVTDGIGLPLNQTRHEESSEPNTAPEGSANVLHGYEGARWGKMTGR